MLQTKEQRIANVDANWVGHIVKNWEDKCDRLLVNCNIIWVLVGFLFCFSFSLEVILDFRFNNPNHQYKANSINHKNDLIENHNSQHFAFYLTVVFANYVGYQQTVKHKLADVVIHSNRLVIKLSHNHGFMTLFTLFFFDIVWIRITHFLDLDKW